MSVYLVYIPPLGGIYYIPNPYTGKNTLRIKDRYSTISKGGTVWIVEKKEKYLGLV